MQTVHASHCVNPHQIDPSSFFDPEMKPPIGRAAALVGRTSGALHCTAWHGKSSFAGQPEGPLPMDFLVVAGSLAGSLRQTSVTNTLTLTHATHVLHTQRQKPVEYYPMRAYARRPRKIVAPAKQSKSCGIAKFPPRRLGFRLDSNRCRSRGIAPCVCVCVYVCVLCPLEAVYGIYLVPPDLVPQKPLGASNLSGITTCSTTDREV